MGLGGGKGFSLFNKGMVSDDNGGEQVCVRKSYLFERIKWNVGEKIISPPF